MVRVFWEANFAIQIYGMNNQTIKILKIDSSPRIRNSYSRLLTGKLVQKLTELYEHAEVKERNLANHLPLLSETMIEAMFANPENLTIERKTILQHSNEVINELKESDILVIGAPVHNFGIPASLKAYIDLATRSGLTFRHEQTGYVGLLKNKIAWIVVTSGGTPLFSNVDYVSGYLKQILGFIGISDIYFIDATQIHTKGEEEIITRAVADIEKIEL